MDAVGDLLRQAGDAMHGRNLRRRIVGRLHCRQQRHDLGLVLPQARTQLVRERLGRRQPEHVAFEPDRAAGLGYLPQHINGERGHISSSQPTVGAVWPPVGRFTRRFTA